MRANFALLITRNYLCGIRVQFNSSTTSSGARAMRGFGAMYLLRRRRCVFLAPQCAALRCPWVSALVLLVVHVPSCARGPPGVLFTAHLHMYNKSVLQYCRYIKNDDHHEPRTKFHLKDNKFRCPCHARLRGRSIH